MKDYGGSSNKHKKRSKDKTKSKNDKGDLIESKDRKDKKNENDKENKKDSKTNKDQSKEKEKSQRKREREKSREKEIEKAERKREKSRERTKGKEKEKKKSRSRSARKKRSPIRRRSSSSFTSYSSLSSQRDSRYRKRRNPNNKRGKKFKQEGEDIEEEYIKKQRKMQMRLAKVRKLKFEEEQKMNQNGNNEIEEEKKGEEEGEVKGKVVEEKAKEVKEELVIEKKETYKDEDQWLEEVDDAFKSSQAKELKKVQPALTEEQQQIQQPVNEEKQEDELDVYMEELEKGAAPQEHVDENFIRPIREALDKQKNQKQNMLKASLGLIVSEINNQAKAQGKKKNVMTQDMFQESYNQAIAGLLNSNLHQKQSQLSIFQEINDQELEVNQKLMQQEQMTIEQQKQQFQQMEEQYAEGIFDEFFEGGENKDVIDQSKVITLDQLMGNKDPDMDLEIVEETEEKVKATEEEDEYYLKFMSQLNESKKKQVFHLQDPTHEISHKARRLQKHVLVEDESSSDGELMLPAEPSEPMHDDDEYFQKKKKNDDRGFLKVVDHSTIDYIPFRKNFYIESKEVMNMTNEQVQEFLLNNGNIKTRGMNCPKPVLNWYSIGLTDKLLQIITKKKKFEKPFPIQAQAFPVIMSGRNCIGVAETGSGKTVAYVLPMLRHILDQPPLSDQDGPIGLIIAPTRELATQIYHETRTFAKPLNLRVVCVYGGTGLQGQLSDLKKGTEIVVCTPGRMIEVLSTSNGKITNLRRVTYVVLDEADRMFDMGFEPQISKILQNIRPDRQIVMFSATFPTNVANLAKKILQNPIEIIVGQRGQACQNIDQIIEIREEGTKLYRLLEILGEWDNKEGQVLIFVDKQSEADELFKELLKYNYQCLVLHGGQDQQDREYTIVDFKKNVRKIMIATSVCARGLDIKGLKLVLNFKCPDHLEDYVHRIGRTGRAGQKGTAITFLQPDEEKYALFLLQALHIGNVPPPKSLIEMAKEFKTKVENGEAKIYNNKIRDGSGFQFDDNEKKKIKNARKALKIQFGFEYGYSDSDESDDEILNKNKGDKQDEDVNPEIKTEEQKKKQEEEIKKQQRQMMELIKDPEIKKVAMAAAAKAAKEAIQVGVKGSSILQVAMDAIKGVLNSCKPKVSSVEMGLQNALKVRDEIEQQEEENSELVSTELEINDYPQIARQKVCSREYLNMLYDLTGCTVSMRGAFVEPGKKSLTGQKKLYLYVKGDSKYNVASCYREIKKRLEELAMSTLGQGGTVGKYTV